jgi:hypothetical protein
MSTAHCTTGRERERSTLSWRGLVFLVFATGGRGFEWEMGGWNPYFALMVTDIVGWDSALRFVEDAWNLF